MSTSIEVLMKELGEIKTFVAEKVAVGTQPLTEEMQRLAKAFEAIQADMQDIRRAKIAAMTADGRIRVREGRLAGYDAMELAMLNSILESRHERMNGRGTWTHSKSAETIREARKSLTATVTPDALFAWEERAMKERRMAYGFNDYNPGAAKFAQDVAAWRSQMAAIVGKALDSTTAGAGDELVQTLEAAQLWMDVNLETVILPILQQTPMPSNPFQMPTQFGDTNWYPIAENVQATTTDPSTNRVTLTAQGLKTGVPFSDELEEDAVIALVPELRRNLARNAAEVIDDVLLNGDTTVANGINSDGATINSGTAGKAHWLLGFDGIIHLAIVDASAAQSNNHNAAVSADMFNVILANLGKYAAPSRRGDVVFVSDVNTAIRSLSITEFETVDVAGARATLSSGEILSVYGKPYLHSAQMRIADTDGKVTDSGGNTVGRLLTFNTTQWRVGFRRQIMMESEREAGKGQTTMYVSFRIALTERSGTRSTATHSAIQYNITGVA